MAAISARHCDRVPQSDPRRGVGAVVGRCVLGFEHTSCDLIRRGAGKPWSAACPRSVGPFLSSVLEQFFHRSGRGILDGFTLLVAASAFLTLAQYRALWVTFKTEGTLELRARQAARGPVVGRARLRRRYHRGELPGRASPGRESSRASLADSCFPPLAVSGLLAW